jgi:hypothetical protein
MLKEKKKKKASLKRGRKRTGGKHSTFALLAGVEPENGIEPWGTCKKVLRKSGQYRASHRNEPIFNDDRGIFD